MTPELKARLNTLEIGLMSEGQHFCLFVRDGCLAMVPCEHGMFGAIGSTGLVLDQGLAYLVYRDEGPVLAARDFQVPAEPEQVEKIRQFSTDLKTALGLADS